MLILLIIFTSGCGNTESNYQVLIESGQTAMIEGNFDEAVISYKEALKEKPNDSKIMEMLILAQETIEKNREEDKSDSQLENQIHSVQPEGILSEGALDEDIENIENKNSEIKNNELKHEQIIKNQVLELSLGLPLEETKRNFKTSFKKLNQDFGYENELINEFNVENDFFYLYLFDGVSVFGDLDLEGKIKRMGIRSEIIPGLDVEDAVFQSNITTFATIALIESLGDGRDREEILDNIIYQRYTEFKGIAQYQSKNAEYLDTTSDKYSLFLAANPLDDFGLEQYIGDDE